MSLLLQAARPVMSCFLVLAIGACGSNSSDQTLQEALKPFFDASSQTAKREALAAAEKAASRESMGALRERRTDPTTERNRKMLHLLRALRYEISWGLTDAELTALVEKGGSGGKSKIEAQIDDLFGSDFVTRDLEVLKDLGHDDALTFVTFLCQGRVVESGPLPAGANTTTWAAEDLEPVVYDLKLSRLATRSALVRSLIEGGDLELPRETCARFRWSGAEPICIELPQH